MTKKPSLTEPVTRKSLALPDAMWQAIDDIRRAWSGGVPSEVVVVRQLLREALTARGHLPKAPTKRTQK